MEVDMVADMKVDKVADMVADKNKKKLADMEVDKVADMMKCIGPKLFDAKYTRLAYLPSFASLFNLSF